ncbi:hypothetical protein [Chitinophaga sp. Cy-1792]|uniref:hypothetical protein n=1 Tax=Chitinophaga sp. Cy-1792 TaxID=2608339 RepID=UPI001423D545|nr:hypothetical protein [Chitinophaga sp. Cy-1792]NIG56125.1 hypothetical protein [Chitinophaga sp. Cy-1792]
MDYKAISALLEKYWNGESSLEEEAMLKAFYAEPHPDMPEDLEEAAPLFQYFGGGEAIPAEPEWDPLPFTETITPVPAKIVRMRPGYNWMKYAAVLLMAVGIGYALKEHQHTKQQANQQLAMEEEQRKAYQETKKALALLSRNLNKGTEKMQQLSYFNTAAVRLSANN